MMQKSFFGRPDETRKFNDFGSLEMTAMAVMIVALVWLGLYPQPVLDLVQPVLDSLATEVGGTTYAAAGFGGGQ